MPVFDRAALVARLLGADELVDELLAGFLGDAAGYRADLGASVTAGASSRARELAHTIKGAAANMGALALAEVAARAEAAGANQDLETVQALLPAVDAQLAELATQLNH